MCGSASVAAKTRHFKDLSDLRVSDLGTVNRDLAGTFGLVQYLK
jgi:hypothetical protein